MREALRTLRGEGMVQLEPHRGHVVAPFTRGDIEDIFWLQATIATELARGRTERITDEEIDELERLNDELADAVETGDGRSHRGGGVRVPPRAQPRRRAASSWPGSCCTSPAICRRCIYADDPQWGVEPRWPTTAS